jgi:integrase/recombinase XerD
MEKYTYRFYLNEKKKKADGKLPIYLRITVRRKKAEMALSQTVLEKDWDTGKERAKNDHLLNETLNALSVKLTRLVRSLENDGEDYDAKMLKDILTNKERRDIYVVEYFQSHIDFITKSPDLQPSTISRYKDTIEHLKNYVKAEKRVNDILIKRIDLKFVKEFEQHLLNHFDKHRKKKLEKNTVNKHIVRLKTIVLKAINEGLLKDNPFKSYRMKYTPAKRDFLTSEEIKKMTDLDFSNNPTLDRVRDIFLWQVYTGLRFADAQKLTVKDVRIEKKKMYLTSIQGKTGETVSIPLFKPAVNIFKKYDNNERKITGKILPQISNQKANVYLRHIATLAGIEKELTTHVARHTCATTILLSNEASMEVVGKWLGHTNIRTTQIYGKITDRYINETAKKIASKI